MLSKLSKLTDYQDKKGPADLVAHSNYGETPAGWINKIIEPNKPDDIIGCTSKVNRVAKGE